MKRTCQEQLHLIAYAYMFGCAIHATSPLQPLFVQCGILELVYTLLWADRLDCCENFAGMGSILCNKGIIDCNLDAC